MLIFKCDLCKSEWQATRAKHQSGFPSYTLAYRDGEVEKDVAIDEKHCSSCQSEIKTARDQAAEKAEAEAIKSLQA